MEIPSFRAVLLLVFLFFTLALPFALSTALRWNDGLQKVEKVGIGFLEHIEDIVVDREGTLYTSPSERWIKTSDGWITRKSPSDGWIKRKRRNEEWENWKLVPSDSGVSGVAPSGNGDLLSCDVKEGLLKINKEGVQLFVSEVNGSKIRFRCLKYWVKGEMEGKTEVFIDNLPGGPDNVNLAPDGSFWIALVELRNGTRQQIMEGLLKNARVIKVGENGKIISKLDDSTGEVMAFVTSALEFEGHLYLASRIANFLGSLKLKQTHEEL